MSYPPQGYPGMQGGAGGPGQAGRQPAPGGYGQPPGQLIGDASGGFVGYQPGAHGGFAPGGPGGPPGPSNKKRNLIIAGVIVGVLLLGGIVALIVALTSGDDDSSAAPPPAPQSSAPAPNTGQMPPSANPSAPPRPSEPAGTQLTRTSPCEMVTGTEAGGVLGVRLSARADPVRKHKGWTYYTCSYRQKSMLRVIVKVTQFSDATGDPDDFTRAVTHGSPGTKTVKGVGDSAATYTAGSNARGIAAAKRETPENLGIYVDAPRWASQSQLIRLAKMALDSKTG